MAEVHFTAWLRTLAPNGPVNTGGATVGDALADVFETLPQLRGYVLDERGALRKHVCIFADGQRLPRETTLSHCIHPRSKLYIMQALSGG